MNELPTLPDPAVSGASAPGGADPSAAPSKPVLSSSEPTLLATLQQPKVLLVGVVVLALLLAGQTWSSHRQVSKLRQEMALRLQKGDTINGETNNLARQVQESSRELQAKVTVLESRQQESQSQQLALEQLYQDLSKNRDEWALTEIEQVLSTASQQLQLAGNVQGALIALQNADRSLARSDKPQFIAVRRAISSDLEKLKATPSVDLAGVALRLDSVIAQVDKLPLLSGEKPLLPATPLREQRGTQAASATSGASNAPLGIGARMLATWRNWSEEMWDDVRQLIRVRSVDTPEALMLSPDQNYFVRENLKLRLMNARLALLSRDETTFAGDLNAAQETLAKYFDTRARSTQQAQAALRQVQANNLAIEMPTLADSLNAVRNYKKP